MYNLVEICEDLYCACYSGIAWPTSSNIFIVTDSCGATLIDAGLDNHGCFEALQSCLRQLDRRIEDVHTVAFTHGHPDHIGGVNAICRRTEPHILIPEECIAEAVDPAQQDYYCIPPRVRAIAPTMTDFDIIGNFNRTCGDWLVDHELLTGMREGETVLAGRYTFQTIRTPGHDIGLTCLYEPDAKIIITGDLLRVNGAGTALPWYTSTAGGAAKYLASLNRIKSLEVDITLPAHGVLTASFTDLVHETENIIHGRESAILSLLETGPKSCEELDAHLYRPRILELCPWFSTVTESHLAKLEQEGRVTCEGRNFTLR